MFQVCATGDATEGQISVQWVWDGSLQVWVCVCLHRKIVLISSINSDWGGGLIHVSTGGTSTALMSDWLFDQAANKVEE